MTADQKPWLVYVRVSSEDQAAKGISLDAQLNACRAYATAKGWEVAEDVQDPGASATTLHRPGMQRALELMRSGTVAGVIAWRLDRLTRSLRDLLALVAMTETNHVGLVSVTESLDTTTPMGRFFVHLLGAIAQWESETIGQRTKAAIHHAKGKGWYTGGSVPAGCKVELADDGRRRRLVPGDGAGQLRQAWGWILAGDSLMDVARKLRAEGVPSGKRQGMDRGKPWTPVTVRRLLLSPMVVGLLTDAATQATVRAALARRSTPTRPGVVVAGSMRSERTAILAGLLRCPTCEASMHQVTARGNGGVYRYYRCGARNKGNCRQKDLKAETVEKAVVDAVAVACGEGGEYHKALHSHMVIAQAAAEGLREERGKLTGERDQLSARIEQLTLKMQIGAPGWHEAMRIIGSKLEGADRRLAEISGGLSAASVDSDSLDYMLGELAKCAGELPKAPYEAQRTFLVQAVGAVRVLPTEVVVDLWEPKAPPTAGGGGTVRSQLDIWGPWRHGKRTIRVVISRSPASPAHFR